MDKASPKAHNDNEMYPPVPPGHVRLQSAFFPTCFQDVSLDCFCDVAIGTESMLESNHFLISLWNEINRALRLPQSDYTPWFYSPALFKSSANKKIIRLGDISTSKGNFHILLQMENRSSINSLRVYNSMMAKKDCQSLFDVLVSRAKQNVNSLQSFTSTIRLACGNSKTIAIYSGKNYYLRSDRRGILISIRLDAIDYIEATQQMMKRLDKLCSFLSVETNLLFEVKGSVVIEKDGRLLPHAVNSQYIKPYIDGPSIRDNVILLSESGVRFLDEFVFVDRDLDENAIVSCFSRSCVHVYEGLQRQNEIAGAVGFATNTHHVGLARKNSPKNQRTVSMSAMSYLSALETASSHEGDRRTCPQCGSQIYKIGARIEDMTRTYLGETVGKAFKVLYGLRSKFLHSGQLSSANFFISVRPYIDPYTASGLVDYEFISCRIEGELASIHIQNIQEWTTYVLRCYYQSKLFGIDSFETEEDHSKDVDIRKQIIESIQKQLPKGFVVVDVAQS